MSRAPSGRYLALLRGVNNAGAGARVSMADLRALFEDLGFRDVRTLLNSGNVVFTAPARGRGDARGRGEATRRAGLGRRIEKALATRLGLTSLLILLSGDEVTTAVARNPLSRVATNPSHLLVIVPRAPADLERLRPLVRRRWSPEALALGRRVAYLWCARGVAKSPLWAAVDRVLERAGTARNIATFTKAAALVAPPDPMPSPPPTPGGRLRSRKRR